MHRRFLSLICLCLGLILLNTNLKAQEEVPEGFKYVTSVEGITEYELESNGLKVLLFPDQSKPTITVNVTYMVGSRHEAYGETGMAHLLEHLVFKGTPNHPDIPAELTEHGASPNGTTWYDRTNYFETFGATDENLEWAIDLEADRMVNSFIAAEDLESEMTVVRNEFESGENDPGSVLNERVLSTAYLWHNYGKSTIGARADLENVPIERLQNFYRKYYQPDNAVLTVAGKIDPMKTLALVKEKFGVIPRPERKLYPTYTREPTQDGERFVELRRVGDVQVVSSAYHIPSGTHSDHPAVAVLMQVLNSEPSGRLYKVLVESGLATSEYGYAVSLAEPSYAYFSADVLKENSLDDAQAAMTKCLDEIVDNPPTAEEVERGKKRLLKNYELRFKRSDRVGLALSEDIAKGDWRLGFLYRDRLEQVTPEQVLAVAKKYFKPSNRTVGRFIPVESPDRAEIPDVPDVKAMMEGYKGKEALAEGEEFDPSPENIESRTKRGEFPRTLEYAFLPKETRGDAVVAQMTLRFGTLEKVKGQGQAAIYAAQMLDKGTKDMSRQEIQDKLDELKARVRISGGATAASVFIETERKNLPEVIDFVGKLLKEPSFSEEEFNKLVQEDLAGIEAQRSEPSAVAIQALQQTTNKYEKDDPRYSMTFDEKIAAVKGTTLDEVKSFYEGFYGASDGTVAVVGDFDEGEVKAAFERNFGEWKSPQRYARLEGFHRDTKGETIELETPDKANAFFVAAQSIPMRDDNEDFAGLTLGNFMLGGGFLNSRLATRIRQQDGLSYGVGSFLNVDDEDEVASIGAYAIYAPENGEKLQDAFREEIKKVVTEGFTQEEVDAAISGWIQSRQNSRAQDNSLSGKLNGYLQTDRTLEWDAELEKKVKALTAEDVNRIMKKYVDLEKMVMVKAGDFAKTRVSKP